MRLITFVHRRACGWSLLSVLLFTFVLLECPAARSEDKAADPAAIKPSPDTIIFKNGDKLTGRLLRAAGSTVTFRSDVAGDIKVDWDMVKELHSPEPFAVLMKGQKINKKTPSSQVAQGAINVKDDTIQVQGSSQVQGPSQTTSRQDQIPTRDAALVIDAAAFERQIHFRPTLFGDWNGAVSAGASTVQATQTSQAFNVGIFLSRVIPTVDWLAPRNRTTANFTQAYGHVTQPNTAAPGQPSNAEDIKTSIYHADAERDEYLSSRFYALVDVGFDHNFSQGLDLQQLYGGGFGVSILKQPKQQLDTRVDVHYERQSFSGSPTIDLVGSTFGETYLRRLPLGLVFNESGLIDGSFNNTDAYSSNVTGNLVFPVYRRLAFNIGAVDDYLNNPPPGFKNNSFQFTTGITYSLR